MSVWRSRRWTPKRRLCVTRSVTAIRSTVAQVAEVWRRGSVIGSWLLDLTASALRQDPDLKKFAGRVSDSGEGRWTLQAAIDEGVPAPVLSAALFGRFESRGAAEYADKLHVGDAARIRRPPRKARGRSEMDAAPSDALVFFGATGDLAYKQIFPALQGLVRDEGLNVPIVGVANAGWTLEQLKARARDSLEQHGGFDEAAFARLAALLNYVDGDYNDPATFQKLRQALASAKRPLHYLAIPPRLFGVVADALAANGLNQNARLVVEKPFGHDLESARALGWTLRKHFPEGGDLPHRPLPGQGAGAEHPLHAVRQCDIRAAVEPRPCPQPSRSPWRRPSASTIAAASTTRLGRCATWSRTICCRCRAI